MKDDLKALDSVNAENIQHVINQSVVETEQTEVASVADGIINDEQNDVSEAEKGRLEKIKVLYEQFRVSISNPYPPEECIFAVDDIPFFAKGDIHAVKAKQKSGKTHVVAILAAVTMGGMWPRITCKFFEPKVLVIDTEQKAADTQLIYGKILKLAGLPEKDNFDRLQVYTLRKMTPKERGEAVQVLVEEFKPDIVFLDGVVDLSCDFNEVSDSQGLIQFLMTLSTDYNCAIVNILHTNKAQEDHNMRGHLGTMLGQKAGNVLECVKTEGKYITVKSADSRHAPVPEWSFTFDENGEPICADENVRIEAINKAMSKAEKEAINKKETEEKRFAVCKAIMSESVGFMSLAKFKKVYQEKAKVGRTTARTHVNALIESHRLIEEDGVIRLATYDEANQE